MSDPIKTASVLGIKIDSHTTRLFLFDIVGGKYTLLATSEATTTHTKPFFDVREGLIKAIDDLQMITGRFLLDDDMNLLIPSQEDGNGVDLLSISYGFLDEVSLIPAGLLEDVSIESNKSLLQMTHLAVTDSIRLSDSRTLEEIFTSINNNLPDMFFLSGGTEDGAKKSVTKLVEIILFCIKHLPNSQIPQIIYAGNSRLSEKLKEISKEHQLKIYQTENVRPSFETENILPALSTLNQLSNQILVKRIPGLAYLFGNAQSQPISYSQGFGVMTKFLSNLNPLSSENALLIDFNKENMIIAGNENKIIKIFKQKNLMLNDGDQFLKKVVVSEIEKWISSEVDHSYLNDYIANKSIHPHSIPENKEDLKIEKSIFRFLLRDSYRNYRSETGNNNNFHHQILINGDYVSLYFSNEELILFLLDSIQPLGLTNLFVDKYGVLPVLGGIAGDNSILPVHLLDSNVISLLAKVFSISSKTRNETPILNVIIEFEDGSRLEELITKGTLKKLPATSGKSVKLFIQAIGNIESKTILKPFEKGVMVQGGSQGIIFDTRNRPINLPKDSTERMNTLRNWRKEMVN